MWIPIVPNPFGTDCLPERLEKQLQFSVDRARNAGHSSQPLLLHDNAHTRDDSLPLHGLPGPGFTQPCPSTHRPANI